MQAIAPVVGKLITFPFGEEQPPNALPIKGSEERPFADRSRAVIRLERDGATPRR